MTSKVNKELLKTVAKMYTGMPKDNWSAYHRMLTLFSNNQVTDSRYCRQPGSAEHDAETLLLYLKANLEHQELVEKYHGQGERTTKQAAETVGLKLPEEYVPSIWKTDK